MLKGVVVAKTSSYTHRMDEDLRTKSEALYNALGLSLGSAIDIFLKKSIRVGGFPFDVRLDSPNQETIEAMIEADRIAKDPTVKAYSVKDAFEELDR